MLDLTPQERRALRAKAHHLDPVVSIGQHGLTSAVMHEIDVALKAHGLIKIRVFDDDRARRDALLVRIADELSAAPVQHLGKLLVLWRPPVEDAPRDNERGPAKRASRQRPAGATRRHGTAPAGAARRAHAPRDRRDDSHASALSVTRRRRGDGGRSTGPAGVRRNGETPSAAAQRRRPGGATAGPRSAGDAGRSARQPASAIGRRRGASETRGTSAPSGARRRRRGG